MNQRGLNIQEGHPIAFPDVPWHNRCPVHPKYTARRAPAKNLRDVPNCSCHTIYERRHR